MTYESAPWIVGVIITLLGGNLGRFIYKSWTEWRARRATKLTPVEQDQAKIDASILTVARARDELEADNARVRETLREERAAHAEEIARKDAEIARYREQIADLEARIVRERIESDTRYGSLLEQVQQLREQHAPTITERFQR